jgi:hypothetical protein
MTLSRPSGPGNPMTDFCVWSNLDFEYELMAGVGYKPGPQLNKLCERWNAILSLLPGCEEASLQPGKGKTFIPWGVTPRVEELAEPESFPPAELVKSINDKRFSHALEVEFGCSLAFARVVKSVAELDAAVESCPFDWVLKHPLGVGGRERVTGKGGRGYAEARRWAESRFMEGWSLVFEPWAYERQEFSFHYLVEPDGKVEFLGQCGLVSDESGAFRGNRVSPGQIPEKSFLSITERAVDRLAQLGYWGPVSIDSFKGKLGDSPVERPLMEINARYSFGRLALELARGIPDGWSLYWWHPKARRRSAVEKTARDYPAGLEAWTPGIFRLPSFADPNGKTGSYLVVAPESKDLDELTQP